MYLSVFLPLFVIMWLKEVALIVLSIFNEKMNWKDLINIYLIAWFLIIIILVIFFIKLMTNNKKLTTYKIKVIKVKNRTAEYYLGYSSVFIVSLVGFSLMNVVDVFVLVLLLIALGVVYIKNDLYFINPTVNMFKSYIYEVEYKNKDNLETKTIISNKKIKPDDTIDIELSQFEFTFMRNKDE